MNKKIAVYPGSFDPIHKGHVDILIKALKLFNFVYVVVSVNPDKDTQTSLLDRYNNVKKTLEKFPNVEVLINENDFIANIAKNHNAEFIIRSARNNQDYNYEMELAAGNNFLNEKLDTILIIPDYKYIKYSSTLLRHKKRLKKDV